MGGGTTREQDSATLRQSWQPPPAVIPAPRRATQAWVPWAINRWRFRRIPGPFAPPVLGNLPGIAAHELHGFLERCRARHGQLFKMYIGSSMVVCVAEPAAARRMLSKQQVRHTGIQLLAGPDDWDFLTHGLVGAK